MMALFQFLSFKILARKGLKSFGGILGYLKPFQRQILQGEGVSARGRVLVYLDDLLVAETTNYLSSGYRTGHTDLLLLESGETPILPQTIAVGTSNIPATHTDTKLHAEIHRIPLTLKLSRENYIARLSSSWSPLEPPAATALAIREIGLSDGKVIGGAFTGSEINDSSLEAWTAGQILTLQATGYTNCIPSDIGKQVKDDGTEVGPLLAYNNTTRKWQIQTASTIALGSVMTITGGTGAGTADGASVAGYFPDSWNLSADANVDRSIVKYHGSYAATVTAGAGAPAKLYQQLATYANYKGKELRLKAAVKHNVASQARICIADGIGTTYSSYHTGGNTWEVLEVTRTIATNASKLEVGLEIIANASGVLFDWTGLFEIGKLWARAVVNISKIDGQVLHIIWEIYTILEEEGAVTRIAFASEELTVSTAVITLTAAKYKPSGQTPASKAYITVGVAPIRFWYDGTAPTTDAGHIAKVDTVIEIEAIEDIENFKVIRDGTVDAKISVTYER